MNARHRYVQSVGSLCLILAAAFLLCGCGSGDENVAVAGRSYIYTGESFTEMENDPFVITINEDGTFFYHETIVSSYLGYGTWSIEGNVLTLTESENSYSIKNSFRVKGDDLIFIEKDSSNFVYIKVKDGERFTGIDEGV